MLVEINETGFSPAVLKVIGLGGAGGNAVNRMLESDIRGVQFLVANTDIQALNASACSNRIQIGASITGGLGSGGDPQIGRKSAEEDRELIRSHLEGADMIFITAGMGGGTGTGASSIVAEVARELGTLTVGVVTRPFTFEGRRRGRQADEGLEQLRECVDTLIIIPNQRLLHIVDRNTPLNEALRVADDVLAHATKGISEIITVPGLINVDFADVRSVMRGMGNALMGMGFAQGADRAREAAQMAISSPLLEDISITGARALLVNFLGGPDMSLAEVDEASNHILQSAGEDANVIFGAVIDPSIKDEMRVTLIATGFGDVGARTATVAGAVVEAERVLSKEFRGLSSVAAPARIDPEPRPGGEVDEGLGVPLVVRGEPPRRAYVEEEIGAVPLSTMLESHPAEVPARVPVRDGIIGAARPMSRPRALSNPASGLAPEDPEIPANVVPLVWKKNVPNADWKPRMSTRWQRVLRRDRLDVPSFLRRRQVD